MRPPRRDGPPRTDLADRAARGVRRGRWQRRSRPRSAVAGLSGDRNAERAGRSLGQPSRRAAGDRPPNWRRGSKSHSWSGGPPPTRIGRGPRRPGRARDHPRRAVASLARRSRPATKVIDPDPLRPRLTPRRRLDLAGQQVDTALPMTDRPDDEARRRYDEIYRRSLDDSEMFWLEAAHRLDWTKPPDRALELRKRPTFRWFRRRRPWRPDPGERLEARPDDGCHVPQGQGCRLACDRRRRTCRGSGRCRAHRGPATDRRLPPSPRERADLGRAAPRGRWPP